MMSLHKNILSRAVSLIDGAVRPQRMSGRQKFACRNFLLLQFPSALGTAVHATPLVQAIREAYPDAKIVVAASGMAREVFANNPFVDRLLELPSPMKELLPALRQLRSANMFYGEPFAVLTSTGNERTPIALTAILSQASYRVGFTTRPDWFDDVYNFDPKQSQIDNNLRLLEPFGITRSGVEPLIAPDLAQKEEAKKLFEDAGLLPGRPVVPLVTQTSVTQRKSWRADRFRQVAQHLVAKYDAQLVFLGTSDEANAIEELRSSIDLPSTSFAGKSSIGTLAAILERCTLGVTLDTGPLHVARAVGLPMVVIAPAWSPPIEWLPVGNVDYRILKNATITSPPTADYIIDEVSVQEVVSAIDDLLHWNFARARQSSANVTQRSASESSSA